MARAVSTFETALLVLLMAEFYPDIPVTSTLIGQAAGCNPVTVRTIYAQLKSAGLLDVSSGQHGIALARDPHEITLWDILDAACDTSVESLFGTARGLSGTCSLGPNIHALCLEALEGARDDMRARLQRISLYDFAWSLPDTYEEDPEQRLRIMGEALRTQAEALAQEDAAARREPGRPAK